MAKSVQPQPPNSIHRRASSRDDFVENDEGLVETHSMDNVHVHPPSTPPSHHRSMSINNNGSSAVPPSPYQPLYSPNPLRPSNSNGRLPTSINASDYSTENGPMSESLDSLPDLPPASPSKRMFNSKPPPPSPSSATFSSDPAKRHARIHSRNLSVFFPRPGGLPANGESGGQSLSEEADEGGEAPVSEIPDGGGGMNGSFRFGSASPSSASNENPSLAGNGEGTGNGAKGRRSHYHKHSLSHNFFSFLPPTDPSLSIATSALSQSMDGVALSPSPSFSHPSSSPLSRDHSHSHSLPSPLSAPVPSSSLILSLLAAPLVIRAKALFGLLEFALGASLWVDGQAGGSVSVTGLGYLVVFDAIGVLGGLGVWAGGLSSETSGLRSPFGNHRLETVILFVEAIFLLFSSVYICKESIEHVLLLGHDHGNDFFELVLPNTLLVVSLSFAFLSAIVFDNHSKLVEAIGSNPFAAFSSTPSSTPSSLRSSPRSSAFGPLERFFQIFQNPFSMTVVLCTASLLVGGLTLPPAALSSLDKFVAVLETISTFVVSYPASLAFGQVLLQTAPPERSIQMIALNKSLREVEGHPLVVYLAPPHCWRLRHHQASTVLPSISKDDSTTASASSAASPSRFRGGSIRPQSAMSALKAATVARDANAALLVVTLVVHVRQDASDQNVLDVTKFVYDRCAPSIGAARTGSSNNNNNKTNGNGNHSGHGGEDGKRRNNDGSIAGGGELTVEVKRGMPRWTER